MTMTPPSTIAVEVDSLPSCSVWPARKDHRATVFFLHGLGDTAQNLGEIISEMWKDPLLDNVKLIMPTAPLAPLSSTKGTRIVPTWFDVFSFNTIDRQEDEPGLYRAAAWLNGLVKAEHTDHNIPIPRIIIGGLSQGGAVSLLTALTTFLPIGGVFVLSSYITLRKKIHEIISPNAKELSIFWGHGSKDSQVPFLAWKTFAEILAGQIGIPFIRSDDDKKFLDAEELKRSGTKGLRFFTYSDLGHWFNQQEIDDLITWIAFLVAQDNTGQVSTSNTDT